MIRTSSNIIYCYIIHYWNLINCTFNKNNVLSKEWDTHNHFFANYIRYNYTVDEKEKKKNVKTNFFDKLTKENIIITFKDKWYKFLIIFY